MLRLLVLDDETITGLGIADLLRGAGFDVIRSVRTVADAVAACKSMTPDVIVSDVMLDGQPAGLELPRSLEAAGRGSIPIVFLSSFDSPYFVDQARDAGAAGYLSKTASLSSLVRAMEAAADGQVAFPVQRQTPPPPTDEELSIITFLSAGFTSGEIALRVGRTEKSVDGSLTRMYQRYGARGRAHLSTIALDRGWITAADVEDASRRPPP